MSWADDEIESWKEAAREYHAARSVVIPATRATEGTNGDGREEPPAVNGPEDYGLGAERGTGHTSAASPQIKLIPFDEITLGTQRRDLVKGLIPRVGLTVIWGPPKCGKSFWGFDVMMHIALGWKYRGRRVNQGPVVYCAFEGAKGFEARKEAFQRRYLAEHQERVPFFLEPVTLDLVRDHRALIATIKTQLGETKPVAVTLDTLNRSIRGSESSDEDMTAYIIAADAIRAAFDCAVIIIHHCGIDGTRPRGHTSLTGACDAQLACKRDPQNNVVVEVEWMKDGAEGAIIASALEVETVGTDEDGEAITSCVVVPVELAATPRAATTRKLSDRQRLALEALAEVTLAHGRDAPPEYQLPGGIKVVTAEQWRAELVGKNILDRDALNPRARFAELRTGLAARKCIGTRDDFVWAARLS